MKEGGVVPQAEGQRGESMACSQLKQQTHVETVGLDIVKGSAHRARHLGFTLWKTETMLGFKQEEALITLPLFLGDGV